MKLEAKDLMIGDWVKTIYSCTIKVHEIKQSCIYTQYNGYEYNEIKPIPITPVILVKNGFTVSDETDQDFVYADGYQILVNFVGGEIDSEPFINLSIQFAEKELWMQIDYIHELQHAMRLFGIEKEIKL